MNPALAIRRLARVLAAALACAAAPAALATPAPRPPGWNKHPPLPLGHAAGPAYQVPARIPAHAVTGGMPGWQITLIAIGAALVAATMAALVDRARAARHKPVTLAASARHARSGAAPMPAPPVR